MSFLDSAQLITLLITLFGSVITLMLGVIAWFIRRYVNQIDVRLNEHAGDINELQISQVKTATEIKNIHHRLREL